MKVLLLLPIPALRQVLTVAAVLLPREVLHNCMVVQAPDYRHIPKDSMIVKILSAFRSVRIASNHHIQTYMSAEEVAAVAAVEAFLLPYRVHPDYMLRKDMPNNSFVFRSRYQ